MAYWQDEDENEQQGGGADPAQNVGPQSATLSQGAPGGAAGASAAAPGMPASQPGGSGKNPGNFVGIKQYLDANRQQSEKLGGQVGDVVNQASQGARDTARQQGDLFNQAVDQNTVRLNQGIVDRAKTDAQGVARDAAQKAEFQRMRDAQYKGPQSFEGSEFYNPTKTAFDKAQKAGADTLTEQGQRGLIGQVQQQKTGRLGSEGVTTFDQMLLGASPEGKAQLAKAREAQSDLSGLFDQTKSAADQRASEGMKTTDATRQAIQQTFGQGGAYGQDAIQNAVNQRVAAQRAQAAADTQRLTERLKAGGLDLTEADLGLLGINPDQYKGLVDQMRSIDQERRSAIGQGGFTFVDPADLGVDLSQFVRARDPNTVINAQNVADANEFARYAALNELMGTENRFLTDPSLAGTATTDALDLEFGGASSYLNDLLNQARGDVATRQQMASAMESLQNFDPVGGFGIPAGYINVGMSDRRQKKGVKHFSADEFLDKLGNKDRERKHA